MRHVRESADPKDPRIRETAIRNIITTNPKIIHSVFSEVLKTLKMTCDLHQSPNLPQTECP